MMDEQEYEPGLGDYVAMIRRRWLAAVLVGAVAMAIGVTVAVLWPPVYRSTATILIEQQEIPQDLVRSTISSFADQRIQLINQHVMTTANLLRIIREHALYADEIDRKPREEIIDRMRKDIHLDMISANVVDPRTGSPMQATIAFTVGYDSRSPQLAVNVANELTSLFLQESSQTRRQQAAEASSFLAEEEKRLSQDVAALETQLADFKEKNSERLPELAGINVQLLNRAEQDLADVRRDRNSLEERRVYLEAQLTQLSPTRDVVSPDGGVIMAPAERLRGLEAYLAQIRGIYTADHPDVVRTERSIAALREQLGVQSDDGADLERELADLRAQRESLLDRYAPAHPDVVRLDERIEAAEERLRAAGDGGSASGERADNPAYLQIEAQIASENLELNALEEKNRELRKKIADLEQRLAQTPAVERDYSALTRDLENVRAKYREVSAKQKEAVVAENLERDAKAERFTLIEPPLLPQRPVSPNRWLIVFLATVLAVGAGVGAIVVGELLDGSVRGPSDLERLVGAPPLGIIPVILTDEDRRAKKRLRIRFAAGSAVAFVLLVVMAHLFIAPLDALWFAALRRFGA